MRNNRLLYWGAQLVGWLSYGLLILLATYSDSADKVDGILLLKIAILVLSGIGFTTLMRNSFIKLGWLELRLNPLIPRVLAASLSCAILISLTTTFLGYLIDVEKESISFLDAIINVFAILILILFWNAIYFTYHFFQKSRKQEMNNLVLEASKNEVELKNLRSQLNPHFLFNSLNSIRALIDIEPAKAKESVTTLSNLLRNSLIMGRENLVTVEQELQMVSNYLELERVRFEERLQVTWDVDDRLNDFLIPPFSLQMLVENAIKHGISNIVNGGEIGIVTRKVGDEVQLIIRNSGTLGSTTDTGIGIKNTRRRLDIQYKGKAEFLLTQEENAVVATLTFKQ